jgi:hypothetical protein
MIHKLSSALLVNTLVASSAAASFTVNYSPPFHGAPCTQYAGWESFTQANGGANAPDDPTTTALNAAVFQLAPGGIVTSAGNLDDDTVPPIYRVTDTVPADLQQVVLQVSINLNPMNWSSFTLSYTDAGGTLHTLAPTSSVYLVHLMGHDERVITWDVSSITDTILGYTIDFAANNTFTTLDAVKLDELYACQPGIPICHPGGVGVIICPCQNPPAGPEQGCDNSSATGGAALSSTGAASLAADSVQLTASDERPTALSIFLQGDANLASGVIFGQGVRCTGGHLKRLYVKNAVAGMVVAPVGTDLSIHAQSAALGDTIVAGSHRYYGVYYRDPVVLGGCPSASTFNITQQLDVLWGA